MKQNQLSNSRLVSYFCRHFDRAMPKSLPAILIIIERILSIVYKQVGTFYKIKKAWIAYFSPFYISGKDHPLTSIFDAINYSTIQWMTICQPGNNAYFRFCYILTLIGNSRSYIPIAPDNLLLLRNCMKYAMR